MWDTNRLIDVKNIKIPRRIRIGVSVIEDLRLFVRMDSIIAKPSIKNGWCIRSENQLFQKFS